MSFLAFLIFLIFNAVVLIYWTILSIAFPIQKSKKINKKKSPFVSVIVCAKNEEGHIGQCITSILSQHYAHFELIVVDDYSRDKTYAIAQDYLNDNSKLSVIQPSKDRPGKKWAITEAIRRAKGSLILLTDADCVVSNAYWIETMVSQMVGHKEIVLGYGPLYAKKNIVNTFSRYETFLTAIQYFSFAVLGRPYMGVGRNLMFTKQVFLDNDGYQSHEQYASGDDDLFIQEVATSHNTATCTHGSSHVWSHSMLSIEDYIQQKKRHLNSANVYKIGDQILLSIYPLAIIAIYLATILLICSSFYKYIIIVTVVRWLGMMCIMMRPSSVLQSKDLIYKYPILEIFHVVYFIYFASTAFGRNKHDWNG